MSAGRPPVRYVAEIHGAQEVTLRGSADLGFWTTRLEEHGLRPQDQGGRAEILATSVSARWKRIGFQELSLAVVVPPPEDEPGSDAVFLVQAYNSSRLFAFCERTFFHTPYRHADVRVAVAGSMSVARAGRTILDARLSAAGAPDRTPLRTGEEPWEGAILLAGGRRFHARLGGAARVLPFTDDDALTLAPGPDDRALRWLAESGFAGEEWLLRETAVHARSRTSSSRPRPAFI